MRTIAVLTLSVSIASATAQTTVSGGIFADATWTLANSPYHVTGDVVLFDTYTLTIEPGVVVQVDAGKTIELRNSRLVAVGTPAQPITFQKAGSGNWGGFIAVGTTDPLFTGNQVQMEHCIGKDATNFMDLDIAYHTPYNFLNCAFSNNSVAFLEGPVSFVQGQYNFDQCTFHENGIALEGGYYYTITNCDFTNNGEAVLAGAWVTGCTFSGNELALRPYGHIDSNILTGNVVAVDGIWNSMNNRFTNNIVVGNEIGVRMGTYFNGSIDFTGNVICNNSIWNIERFAAGSNNTADLSGNCFCTDDAVAIEQSIFHAVDDVGVGLIVFSPFDTDPACIGFSLGTPDHALARMELYPNPATDMLTVSLPEDLQGVAILTLFDATGRAVLTTPVNSPVLHLDLGALPSGTFQAVLRTEQQVTTGRVVVMR